MRDRLWLVKNGMSDTAAFTLPPEDVTAYGIIFGEFEGNSFDCDAWRWTPKKDGS